MTTSVRISTHYYHVTVNGKTIAVAKGIGPDRITQEEAVAKAERILEARSNG